MLPQPGRGLPWDLLVLRTLVCTTGRGRRGLLSFSESCQACLHSRLTSPPPSHFLLRPTGPVPTSGWCFQRVGGGGPGSPSAGTVWESASRSCENRVWGAESSLCRGRWEVIRPKALQGEAGWVGEYLSRLRRGAPPGAPPRQVPPELQPALGEGWSGRVAGLPQSAPLPVGLRAVGAPLAQFPFL